ncbi:MAG: hypothetical protein RIG84_00860 [Roseovarius sp.]
MRIKEFFTGRPQNYTKAYLPVLVLGAYAAAETERSFLKIETRFEVSETNASQTKPAVDLIAPLAGRPNDNLRRACLSPAKKAAQEKPCVIRAWLSTVLPQHGVGMPAFHPYAEEATGEWRLQA